jgi:lipopolysaccharide/colanic/teichoic acid biosynthesis glycosyltransferase
MNKRGKSIKIDKTENKISKYLNTEKKAQWAEPHDPRITRVGRFLRQVHWDEIPQFFNILKGHMSIVDPCPK